MKITDPVLAPDVSLWCDHILTAEFIAGGCESIVIGLYKGADGKLHPTCRKQFEAAAKTSLVIQAYYWDDITYSGPEQADWVIQTIKSEGLPVKWIFADQEQCWSDWSKWYAWRRGEITWAQVPKASPENISSHNAAFIARLNSQFPNSGVYTNNGFVASWAYPMNNWLPKYKSWIPQYYRQPSPAKQMTWTELKANWMPNFDIALAPGQLPVNVMGCQFTGDSCILPGSYDQYNRPMPLDVSVFSKTFIDALRNDATIPQNQPQTGTMPSFTAYRVIYARINVRTAPSGSAGWVRYAVLNERLQVVNIANGWAKLADGSYVYAAYIQAV